MGTEGAIVASMAQSAFARYSEEAAEAIRTQMRGAADLDDRGVHQAGFYVLVGASMPAVLIELGYLTNKHDVAIVKSSSGQKKLARAIAKGIQNYERVYSASLN
jgi:N-acetylmuramoyl-L-alanine amidase